MMMRRLAACLLMVSLVLGCGGDPTAPRSAVLVLSQQTLLLVRHDTELLTASAHSDGAPVDVTAQAQWRSSNALVARVEAGAITAVRPGTAIVTVDYQGQVKTVDVTVRARTELKGEIKVTNALGQRSILLMYAQLDGKDVGYNAVDLIPIASMTALVRRSTHFDPSVSPGSHELTIVIAHHGGPHTYLAQPDIRLVDSDTGLELATLNLVPQDATLDQASNVIRWPISIQMFTQ